MAIEGLVERMFCRSCFRCPFAVAIMVVDYHEVLAADTEGDGEAVGLVRGDFTSQFNCLKKNLVGLAWGIMLAWEDNRGWCD